MRDEGRGGVDVPVARGVGALNPALRSEAITAAMDELIRDRRDRSAMIPGLPFYLKWPVYCSVKHSI
jgi:hypothetical protein